MSFAPSGLLDEPPLVNCLCITQGGRESWLRQAVSDFARQTYSPRELLIVHDGDAATACGIEEIAAGCVEAPVRVSRVEPGLTLGELRNLGIAEATGPLVCQWDDDDRHHPLRLERQYAALRAEGAAACFLVDQLQYFEDEAALYWVDWNIERYPYNLIPGTLLGWREQLPAYAMLRKGEDSSLVEGLLRRGGPIARLRGVGWLYVYRYTGHNTFDRDHHAAIATMKRMNGARLLCERENLQARLAEYLPPLPPLRVPWRDGHFVID